MSKIIRVVSLRADMGSLFFTIRAPELADAIGCLVGEFGFDAVKGALADVCKGKVSKWAASPTGTGEDELTNLAIAAKWERLADRLAGIPSEGV